MILVTGSTGAFGSNVLKQLQKNNIAIRAVSKDDSFDWSKPETFDNTLTGIDKVFLISPPNYQPFDAEIIPFVQKAKEAGVKFILLSTLYGTDNTPETTFGKAEKVVRESGINYAIVRPNFIFENFINYDLQAIKNGVIYLPTANSKTSYIDVRDVAKASVKILLDPEEHSGKAYTLTGSQSLSHEEIAAVFSEVLGKTITNVAPTNDEYKATLVTYNLPQPVVDFMGYLYSAIEAGHFSGISDDYYKITGEHPTTIKAFIEQHFAVFAD